MNDAHASESSQLNLVPANECDAKRSSIAELVHSSNLIQNLKLNHIETRHRRQFMSLVVLCVDAVAAEGLQLYQACACSTYVNAGHTVGV